MNTSFTLSRAVRAILMGGIASALIVPVAGAQQEERRPIGDQPPAAPVSLDPVTVTGTRIKRDESELTQPTAIVDGEYLAQRGITNAQSALASVPAIFNAASPIIASNTAGASQGVGQRTLNLFELGSQRTLTLVDGMRFVSSNSPVGGGSAAGSQVDVNNIPVTLINRIEVVKVGGAAVYGADAVSGVVNYVLRTDYEGAEFAVDYRNFGEGITEEVSTRGLIGGNFSEGRGNFVLSGEFNRTKNVRSNEVPTLRDSWTLQQATAADRVLREDGTVVPGQLRLYPQPRAGILSFSGLLTPGPLAITNLNVGIWPDGNFYQMDPAGTGQLAPYDRGIPTGNAVWASGGDGLDLVETNTAQEGADRYNISALLNYALTDTVSMKAAVFSNRMNASNPGFQAARYSSGVFGSLARALQFSTDHPFLPDASQATLEGLLGGPGVFYMHRGWLDFGAREIINDTSTNLYRVGFDGSFALADRDWEWNITGQKGWSAITSETTETNDNRWFAAMDAGINPSTGQIDCRYNYDPTVGANYVVTGFGITSTENILGARGSCRPFDPFGTPSQESIDYMSYKNIAQTRLEQDVAIAYVSGSLFDLPGGPLSLAFGYEHRRESAEFADDGTSKLIGFSDSSLSGGYRTNDYFVETLVPLFSPDMGIPGLHQVGIEASFRAMDNSRSGNDNAWAVGLSYRPFESLFGDLMIRVNIGETVRAPAVTELFLPVVESAQFAADPCHGANLTRGGDPATRQANCAAEGIPTDFVSLATNASRRGFNGGNINLQTEQAESLNVGLVYTPSFVPGRLTILADYTRIEIEDAIVSFTLTNLMEACYDSTNYPNDFCTKFVRGPDFQLPAIDAFTSGFVNAALRNFAVYEFGILYGFDTDRFGTFNIDTRTYRLLRNEISNTGFDFTDSTGAFNNPTWRGNVVLRHDLGRFSSFIDIFYNGSGKRDAQNTEPLRYIDNKGNPYTTLPSFTTASIGSSYALTEKIDVRAQIQNVTDWEPNNREANAGRWTWGRTYNFGVHMKF